MDKENVNKYKYKCKYVYVNLRYLCNFNLVEQYIKIEYSSMEYYSVSKKREILSFVTTNLEHVMLNEINQMQKEK